MSTLKIKREESRYVITVDDLMILVFHHSDYRDAIKYVVSYVLRLKKEKDVEILKHIANGSRLTSRQKQIKNFIRAYYDLVDDRQADSHNGAMFHIDAVVMMIEAWYLQQSENKTP